MLGKIASLAGCVFILAAVCGLINKIFDAKLGLRSGGSVTEVPGDPVIVAVLFMLGALCLIPALFSLRKTGATS